MSEKPWIKLWARWYESSSHALLSPDALHTGPHLLVLAGKYGRQDDGSARLLGPQGEPLTIAALAKLTRWPSGRMSKIIAELRQCGTLDVVGAVYTFPSFDRWQESKSAARMRKYRARTVTGHRDGSVTTEDRRQKTEDRGQTPNPPSLHPPDSPAEREAIEIEQLRDRLPHARRPQGCNALYLADHKLRELLRAGVTVDEAIETVEAFADAVDRGDESRTDWRGNYVLSLAWFERIRATYVQAGDAPTTADTLEQALDREQETGHLPAGWQRNEHGVVGPNGRLYPAEVSP